MRVSVEGAHAARRKEVQHLLNAAGLKGVKCSGIASVYRLEGDLTILDAEKVASELLCDPIVETFAVNNHPSDKKACFADVWYKPGVTDAAGDSVLKAIAGMSGIKPGNIQRAFSGTRYEFTLGGAKSALGAVQDFVNRELLNPLVQECKIIKP